MATLVIPGAVQVGIEMQQSGQKIMNVLGFANSMGVDLPTILASVKTNWEKTGGPLWNHQNSLTMVGYHGVDLSTPTGAVGFLGSTTPGNKAGETATLAACAIVKLSSNTRSRSQNGRLYHGPLMEGDINPDGRTISSGTLTAITSAYEQFRIDMEASSHAWAVLSRKNSTYKEIESASTIGIIGTQRRRLR